jgi:DNA adenine methylase
MAARVNRTGSVPKADSPIFRWAGSKQKLLPVLLGQVPETFETYLEPFVGSARLFFALKPKRAILGDFNKDLISTYRTIKSRPKEVHSQASEMPDDEDFYYNLRDNPDSKGNHVYRAARFTYLNRYCFNGVYRTNLSGKFNVPRGTGSGHFPSLDSFLTCAATLRGTRLVAGDFEQVLALACKGDFVYLDPPYAKTTGRFRGEYGHGSFSASDVTRLVASLEQLNEKGARFLLSYCLCPEIRPALERWTSRTLLVKRHVAGFSKHRKKKREVLIANFPLTSQATKSRLA